jgi:hypothetical protein
MIRFPQTISGFQIRHPKLSVSVLKIEMDVILSNELLLKI